MSRVVSGLGFAAAVAAFALPFGLVSSCNGDEQVEFTGVELVTQSVPSDGGDLHEDVEENAAAPATLLALAAIIGLGLSVARRRGGGICAVVGLIAAQVLAVAIVASASGSSSLLVGYWLALGGTAVAGIAHLVAGIGARRAAGRDNWGWATLRVLVALSPTLLLAMAFGVGALVE